MEKKCKGIMAGCVILTALFFVQNYSNVEALELLKAQQMQFFKGGGCNEYCDDVPCSTEIDCSHEECDPYKPFDCTPEWKTPNGVEYECKELENCGCVVDPDYNGPFGYWKMRCCCMYNLWTPLGWSCDGNRQIEERICVKRCHTDY